MTSMRDESVYFREEQRFSQIWLVTIIAGITVLIWYFFIAQILFRKPLGKNPASDLLMVIFWIIFGIGFPAFFMVIKLVIEVKQGGIRFRFVPFHRKWKELDFKEIRDVKVHVYKPLRDYGGWGIRGSSAHKVFTVRGNEGVLFELSDGTTYLLGSQRPRQLLSTVQSFLSG